MAAAHGYIGRSPGDSATVIARQSFSPTGIQTDFTFAAGYSVGYVDLYLNGARLIEGQDFSATDGSTVGLTTNAVNGDVLEVVAFKAFNASNVSAASGNFTVSENLTVSGTAEVTGAITATGGVVGDVTGNATGLSGTPDLTIRNLTGVAATFTGIVSYDDVVNVDSVGFATFRSGINVQGAGSTTTTLNVSGVATVSNNISIGDSIFHIGDGGGTTFGFPAADTFTVYTDGSERVRVNSSGDIGITSTSPRAKLDIKDGGTSQDVILRVSADDNNPYGLVVGNDAFNRTSNRGLALWVGADKVHHIEARTSTTNGENELIVSAGDDISFRTNVSSEVLRITSGGNVGIGTTLAGGKLQIDGGELLVGTKTVKSIASTTNATAIFRDDGGAHTIIAVESSAASGGGTIALSASRNNTDNGYTIIQNNDVLGEVRFAGDDGTNLQHYGARIKSAVDGSPAENNMPGRLEFHTNSGGETTAERLRIDSSGRLKIGTISNYSAGVTNAPVYIAMQSDITGIGDDEGDTTAGMVRIEETGSNDGRYHGIDLRNKNAGDIRLLNSDRSTNDRGDLILVMPDEDASDGTHLKMRFNSLQSSIQISGKGGAVTPNSGEAHTDIYIATKTGMTAVNTALGTEVAGLIRFEDRGTNNNRYHGIELRNRNSGDARILNLDEATTNKSNLVFAIDNGTTVVEALRLNSSGNAVFAGTVSDSIGPLRRLGITNHNASTLTLAATHAGNLIREATNSANITLPQNVFTAGDMITIFNVSSGDNTITQGTGVTLYNTADAATGNRTLAAKGVCTIACTSSNEFIISGSGLS